MTSESEIKPMIPSADCSIPTETSDDEYIQLLASIEEMLAGSAPISLDYTIFRVPTKLRELNDKAYTPQVVSIGPLHRGKPELIGMEGYKVSYLKEFLDRTPMTVKSCLKLIRAWEERGRSCYAETILLSSDEFTKMVLVDSGFIIESILRYWLGEQEHVVFEFVMDDLILVENQLPFFVLDGIFHLAFFIHYPSENNRFPSFLKLSVSNLRNYLLIESPPQCMISSSEVKHFVDLLRMIHLPPSSRSWSTPRGDNEYIRVKTATELQEAGMKIKCATSSSKSFTYDGSKGVLEIPRFSVTDDTEPVLRNLIALELYLYRTNSYVLDCVYFMDDLIDGAKDVDILVNNGVMTNYLGESEAVANMFNNLNTYVGSDSDKYCFCRLSRSLNSYCMVPRNQWN